MKRKLWPSILKAGAVLVLAISLVVGMAFPGLADGDDEVSAECKLPPNWLKGLVVSVGEQSFEIESAAGELTTISVDDNTKYYKVRLPQRVAPLAGGNAVQKRVMLQERDGEGPASLQPSSGAGLKQGIQKRVEQGMQKIKDVQRGLGPKVEEFDIEEDVLADVQAEEELIEEAENAFIAGEEQGWLKRWWHRLNWLRKYGEEANFEDIEVGDRVAVKVMPNENLAKLVLIVKASVLKRVSGTIETVSSDSITINVPDGDPAQVTLTIDENTVCILRGTLVPETGQSVSAIYNSQTDVARLIRINPAAE